MRINPKKQAYEKKLIQLVPVIFAYLKKPKAQVTVTLLSDAQMRVLEKKYMHKEKKIVNVLSFKTPDGFPHPENPLKTVGDVYINWDIHQKEKSRMKFLLVHGILHILGYRHGTKHDSMRMQNLEKRICRHILLPVSTLEHQPSRLSLPRAVHRGN